MAALVFIVGLAIVGLVVAQLVFGVAATAVALDRERKARRLAQQIWLERVESANDMRAQKRLVAAAWNGYRKFVVDRRVDEGDGICSFYLVPHDGKKLPGFMPGQYLTFRLEIPGQPKPVVRCYSLSDAPNPDWYRVTIKRVPAPRGCDDAPPGLVSNYFHDHINESQILDVKAPGGHFVLDLAEKRPVVLIGGGVGITPMLSMFNTVYSSGADRQTRLFYAVRNSREHAMKEHLRQLARERENLQVTTIYSDPLEEDVHGRDYDESGYLSVDLLRNYLRDGDGQPTNNFLFYVCGPPPMMETLLPQLEEWGVPKHDIHTEAFGPASVKARGKKPKVEAEKAPASEDKPVRVTFAKSGTQLTWDARCTNLLEFAEENGVQIDSACCAGGCATCQVAVKSGEVIYDVTPECDIETGCCLTCVGRPKGDLVLDA